MEGGFFLNIGKGKTKNKGFVGLLGNIVVRVGGEQGAVVGQFDIWSHRGHSVVMRR